MIKLRKVYEKVAPYLQSPTTIDLIVIYQFTPYGQLTEEEKYKLSSEIGLA
jgi:hypothetical protein